MYICLDCDTIFETPRQYIETHGLDTPPYEAYWGCPKCGGAYIETYECDRCGQYIVGDYIEFDNGLRICDDCYESKSVQDELWV